METLYLELSKIDLENSLNERISRVFEFAIKLSKIRYPQFNYLQDDLATLRYRLCDRRHGLDIFNKERTHIWKR